MTPSSSYRSKIVTLEDLVRISGKAASTGQRRVLCHGKFEVMHPGHMRHLEWSRQQGDLLFVTLCENCDEWTSNVSLEARLEYLAALYMVDYVAPVPCMDATLSVNELHPEVLVRGQEFQTLRRRTAGRERAELAKFGGELLFSAGLGGYSVLGSEDRSGPFKGSAAAVSQMIARRDVKFAHLDEILARFTGLKVAIIGDSIVDEYLFCDALGMSAEDPVIVVRPRKSNRYIGGAAIVAEHAQALGAQCHFFSVVGDDDGAEFVTDYATTSDVEYHLLRDPTRPTTIKQRFIAGGKKLLRVSYVEESPVSDDLSEQLVESFAEVLSDLDLVIFSDFSYGANSPLVVRQVSELARQRSKLVTADVQCSSQIATITKYKDVNLATPTEREARMSLWDMESSLAQIGQDLLRKTRDRDLIIKLGESGLLILHGRWEGDRLTDIDTEYLSSFADEVNDPMGAGDALLAASSLTLAAGGSIFEASLLGNVAAALEVSEVGNVPVTRAKLERKLTRLLEPLVRMRA